MSMTRSQLIDHTARWADALGSTRWFGFPPGSSQTGATEVSDIMQLVWQREWKRILNANRHYRMNKVTPTTDAAGFIPVSALTTGAGNAVRHFYRVLTWVFNNYQYKTGTQEEWALGQNQGVAPRIYFLSDNGTAPAFMQLPVATNTTFDGVGSFIWVNWFPQNFVNYADGDVVDFPDGYEEIVAIESAAALLAKGGAEIQATNDLKRIAEEFRSEMLQDIARETGKAMRVQFEDTSAMWAGN
jgi:hypothetical protein